MTGCSNFYTVNYNVMVSSLWVIRTLYMPYGSPLSEYDLQEKQDRQRTYNATLFVEPFLLWKSNKYQIFWVCVCSLRYLACNVHVPYCHLCPVQLDSSLTNGTFFEDTLSNTKCVFWFSVQSFSETFFHSKKNWAIYYYRKCTFLRVKYELLLSRFNETWILWTDFRK